MINKSENTKRVPKRKKATDEVGVIKEEKVNIPLTHRSLGDQLAKIIGKTVGIVPFPTPTPIQKIKKKNVDITRNNN